MKASVILSIASLTGLAAAHGIVQQLIIDGTSHVGYLPNTDPYQNPPPARIAWSIPGDGPVQDVTSKSIACNVDSRPGALIATATAGSEVKFFWNTWPTSHHGPTMTYLASCTSGDCRKEDPTKLEWFKIDHAGLNADGTWISDTIIKNNNTYTITIPKELKPGPYLMRHELLALHASDQLNGAQFYPMCTNLEIKGTGTGSPDKTVKFPGAYKPDDKGILLNIWWPTPTSYEIPGPPLVKLTSSDSGSDDGQTKPTPTPTESPSTPVVTPEVTPVVTPVVTSPVTQTPDPVETESPTYTDLAPELQVEVPQTTTTPTPTPTPPAPTPTPTATPTPEPVVHDTYSCPKRKVKRFIREELRKKNSA